MKGHQTQHRDITNRKNHKCISIKTEVMEMVTERGFDNLERTWK